MHVLFHRLQLRSPLKHRQSSLAWNLHSTPCCGQPFTAISQVNIADVPCLTTMAITSLVSSLYRQGAPITPGSHQDYINGIRDSLEVATPHYKTVKILKVFTELIKHMKVTFWYYMNDRGCTQQTLQARALSDFHDSLTQLQLGTKKMFLKTCMFTWAIIGSFWHVMIFLVHPKVGSYYLPFTKSSCTP